MAKLARQSKTTLSPQVNLAPQANPDQVPPLVAVPKESLAKLAALHEEAGETARLANLLGACPRTIAGMTVLALASTWLCGAALWASVLWLGFIASAVAMLLHAYYRTIRRPFARLRLKRFASRLSAGLLYAGFAWGAGAYLIVPADGGPLAAALFVAAPALAILFWLHEREAVFLFILPATVLCAFAAVLRPFADATLASASVVIAGAVIAALAVARDPHRSSDTHKPAMLSWQ